MRWWGLVGEILQPADFISDDITTHTGTSHQNFERLLLGTMWK